MPRSVIGFFTVFLLILAGQQGAPQKKSQKKESPKAAAPATAAEPAQPAPPAEPTEKRQYNYVYDLNGQPVPSIPTSREERKPGGVVEREEVFRNAEGRPVTARSTEERVLSDREGDRTSERVIQRYDPTGRPTNKQMVRMERRKTPDGSVVITETTYEQDVNGRMQFAERRTTTDKKTPAGGNTTILLERNSINGGAQVVERTDRVETKRSDTVTESVSSRKFVDANGRLEEREREAGQVTKSGNVTNSDTKQWRLGPTGQMEFISEIVAHQIDKPDGGQVEDKKVYSTLMSGTTPDLNNPQTPTLEQQVHREKKVQPDGKIIETTTEHVRQVADPTRLGGLVVVDKVTTPTADGKTIQTTVSERDANGRMLKARTEVEEEKK